MPERSEFPSRYPRYNVLDKWTSPDWDDQTREVVRQRLDDVPPIRFFTAAEANVLAAVVDRIIPQPDRSSSERVPIVPWIDAKLHNDDRDGYRYDGLPPQREAWRLGIAGIRETARARYGREFVELAPETQDDVLRCIEGGNPPGESWSKLPAKRFFASVLCSTVVKIYYGHPSAWTETGYNGPSSPRGHVRKWIGGVDPWEAHERETLWGTG